jgi:hypothetical protein
MMAPTVTVLELMVRCGGTDPGLQSHCYHS